MRNLIKKVIQRWQWFVFILALMFVVVFFSSEPKYLSIITGIWTMIVSLAVINISYWQWKTAEGQRILARNKFRLDLFDKRSAIYGAAIKFVSTFINKGQSQEFEEAFGALVARIPESHWLLSEKVHGRLVALTQKALEHKIETATLPVLTDPDKRKESAAKLAEIEKWFLGQYRELGEVFRPFMRIRVK